MKTTSTATASTVATQTSRGSGGLFIKNIYHITQRSTLTKRKRNLLDFPSHIRDKNVGFPVGRSRYPQETGSCQVWVTCGRRHGKNFLTLLQHWSGAVTCPACFCGGCAAGPNALRIGSQSKPRTLQCADPSGFSRSPERPFLHYVVMSSPIPSTSNAVVVAWPHLLKSFSDATTL